MASFAVTVPASLILARRALHGTTLLMAWNWTAGVACCWIVASLATWPGGNQVPEAAADQLWYAVAVGLLCPPIAVLGCKRPMSRVWSGFIVLPLVLVFAWPAASAWGSRFPARWVIEEPLLVGYIFVLVMGIGNYLGTRHALGATLWALAALLLMLPLCPPTARWFSDAVACRAAATCAMSVAAVWEIWRARIRPPTSGLEFVFQEFRHAFGIVWGRRMQERFNDTARKSQWTLVLGPHGFVDRQGQPAALHDLDAQTLLGMEGALRWLLRRFVDPDWIDRRMSQPEAATRL